MNKNYSLQVIFYTTIFIVSIGITYGQRQIEIWNLSVNTEQARELVKDADSLFYLNKYNKAALIYEEIVKLNPQDIESLENLAISYYYLKDYRNSILYYEKVIAYMESDHTDGLRHYKRDGLYNLACVYSLINDIDSSFNAMLGAIDEGFDNVRSIENDSDLSNLRADERYEKIVKKLRITEFYSDSDNSTNPSPEQIIEGVKIAYKVISERHPNPYRHFSADQWDKRVNEIISKVHVLTETEYFVEMIGLLGMAGDVHTSVFPRGNNLLQKSYGLRFWKFRDGIYIRAASKELEYLVGAKVLAINGINIEDAWEIFMNKFPSENKWMTTYMSQFYMQFPSLLHALKLSETDEGGSWTFKLKNGGIEQINLTANENVGYSKAMSTSLAINKLPEGWVSTHDSYKEKPLWLRNENENYWYEVLAKEKAVFLQMNVPRNDRKKPWEKFLNGMFNEIDKNDNIDKLIVDLRHHEGGWHYMAKDLVRKILQSKKIDKPGALYIITGRITQSAGLAFIAWPEMDTYPIIVGEPAGAHPILYNGAWGNHRPIQLPGTGITIRVSTHMQQFSDAIDDRHIVAPDLPTKMTFKQYEEGDDPALIEALNFPVDKGHLFFKDAGGRPIPRYLPWRRLSQINAFEEKR